MKTLLPSLPVPGVTPVTGADLSRRGFLRLGTSGLVASWFLNSPAAAWAATSAAVTPKGTARNVIFIFLVGAPSQVDTWDLKEGAWTPSDFAPTSFGSGLRFPAGLMPNLANRVSDLAFVRSLKAGALVHQLSQAWIQIARNPVRATGANVPNIGSVAALELEKQRGPNDVLPAFLALNMQTSLNDEGYFPASCAPLCRPADPDGPAGPEASGRFGPREPLEDPPGPRRGAPERPAAGKGRGRRGDVLRPGQAPRGHAGSQRPLHVLGCGCGPLRLDDVRQRLPRRQAGPRGRARYAFRHDFAGGLGQPRLHLQQVRAPGPPRTGEPLQFIDPARRGARDPDRRPQGGTRARPPARRSSTRR